MQRNMPGHKSCKILFVSSLFKFITGKHCFEFLKRRLPSPTVKRLDGLLKLKCKIAVQDCRLRFLKVCLTTGMFPHRYFRSLRADRICPTGKNLRRLTKNQVEETQATLTNLKRTHSSAYYVTKDLSLYGYLKFMKFCTDTVHKVKLKENARLNKSLSSEKTMASVLDNPEKYVRNLSSYVLNKIETEALAYGLKFCIIPKHINRIESQAQFEMLYDQIFKLTPTSAESVGLLKAKLVDLEHQYRTTPSKQTCPLTSEHLNALKALKANKTLVILKPDKGSGAVLMDRSDYQCKMEEILSDESKFKLDPKINKPEDLDTIMRKEIQSLANEQLISEATAKMLTPRGSQTPLMYGLPKLHKPDIPLRPILSMVNSAQHAMARWLADILKPVRQSFDPNILRDTFELVGILDTININNKHMASMDIASLFTNVPLEETVKIISERINDKQIKLGIPTPTLERLLLLCTANIQFKFADKLYRQIDGVAMGSPLGPILADIFMAHLEENISSTIGNLVFYRRYVDDIIIITTDKQQATSFQASMNQVHKNISLSMEHEHNDTLSFLDILIRRRADGTVQRSVYRKETWTGQYLNFHSFVPVQYKRGLVRTLFHRARKICTQDTLEEEIVTLKNILHLNGYPYGFIKRYSQEPKPTPNETSVPKLKVLLQLTFRGDDVMQRIQKRLITAVGQTYWAASPVIIYKTTPIPLPVTKDPVPLYAKSNCIYQFTCRCQSTYIGRTERQLNTRVKEHIPNWIERFINKEPGNPTGSAQQVTATQHRPPASSIGQHIIDTGHVIDRTNCFRILYRTQHSRMLKMAEAVCINSLRPNLCKQKDMMAAISSALFVSMVTCLVTVTSGTSYPSVQYVDRNCDSKITVTSDVRIQLSSNSFLNPGDVCYVTLVPNQGSALVATFINYNMNASYVDEFGNCQYESIQMTDFNGYNVLGSINYCSSQKPTDQISLQKQGTFGYTIGATITPYTANVDLLVSEVVFNQGSCPSGYFDCQNFNCVTEDVTCNGYDDCGNNEDEISGCGLFVSLRVGVVVGIVVGVIVFVVIVVVLSLLFRRYRRRVPYVQYN